MADPEKILVRGVNWLGDSVMTTPALSRLREAKPEAHITILTPAKLADLWHFHPAVDSVIPFAAEESMLQVAARLRLERFHTALVFPNSTRSALEVWLARIPKRIGYAGRGRSLLLTYPLAPARDAVRTRKRSNSEIQVRLRSGFALASPDFSLASHHIYRYLHLVAALGAKAVPSAPYLEVTDHEMQAAARRFDLEVDVPGSPLFGLNPGAEYGSAKRWPVERFIAAACEVQKRTHCRWVLFGGQSDVEEAARISEAIQSVSDRRRERMNRRAERVVWNLAGATTLRELCVTLKACELVLTNDTGPMHVAAAVGTRVVAPFGSTSPELTGPGLPGNSQHSIVNAEVSCSPCFRRECPIDLRCMNGISVERVVQEIASLYRQQERASADMDPIIVPNHAFVRASEV